MWLVTISDPDQMTDEGLEPMAQVAFVSEAEADRFIGVIEEEFDLVNLGDVDAWKTEPHTEAEAKQELADLQKALNEGDEE